MIVLINNKKKEKIMENGYKDLGIKTFAWCWIICAIIGNMIMLPWSEIFAGQHSLLDIVWNVFVISLCSFFVAVALAIFIDILCEDDDGTSGY